ncbi:hypothetical protein FGSG_13261 [Fusarium graminearum PH-1]|uniref:hypothetical protein n=1 Tax=Gibberella zeae (strain ATCC MYA-4620 / CBS 123657 / FGSC 9075 / NRRL 31084 / PH-1) TaxID=229533 RepID=UPI00021F13E4|nr:hypothetical protein FGSG_13261 [Fusarium graminearum PH-1]ESU14313.1 hypothetical protein FGSG_13261 [Fusarium graminearum PH-1]|eukprot:XP_011319738.1 hypothetical protein FGSG_13261 [Fusarium graminearum PH-1]
MNRWLSLSELVDKCNGYYRAQALATDYDPFRWNTRGMNGPVDNGNSICDDAFLAGRASRLSVSTVVEGKTMSVCGISRIKGTVAVRAPTAGHCAAGAMEVED